MTGKDPKTDMPAGIFIFIQDSSSKHIHYDEEFKKYATINYLEKALDGDIIS